MPRAGIEKGSAASRGEDLSDTIMRLVEIEEQALARNHPPPGEFYGR
jgi:hypothetical protein